MKINEINIIEKTLPYSTVIDYVQFVIQNCFDSENGRFHQYKYDYAMAVAIIAMYTDYDGKIYDYDEVMEFIYSKRWKEITEELGLKYTMFKYYLDAEVDNLRQPFAFANETMNVVKTAISQFSELLKVIDVEKLKNYDMTEFIKAVDKLNGDADKVGEVEKSSKPDNVVSISNKAENVENAEDV